jgi:hypothetical protein
MRLWEVVKHSEKDIETVRRSETQWERYWDSERDIEGHRVKNREQEWKSFGSNKETSMSLN